ncbi:hypothetical protein Tco_0266216 [Tanacetum coccineum]
MATRLVSCVRMEEAANSTCMENQMLVQFDRERAANRADARGLMKIIFKWRVTLIKEVKILVGSIPSVQGTSNLKRAPERDVENPSSLNEMVFEARCDAHDKTGYMMLVHGRII